MPGKNSTNHAQPVTGSAIRRTFLDYFEARGHRIVPSSSLIPRNDPTVLLTTAGMQQMIPFFLGREEPPARRLTSVQKCFRTTDIDAVGDASHLTFFEMLGNFSVGDYFKREAIAHAWELLTQGYGIRGDRLHPTVHPDDEESPALWQEITGIPQDTITRLADNWWGPPGTSGPCGPDSEIYYDRGAEVGCGQPDCAPGHNETCERYLEVWNLVFMQYYQDPEGHRTPLKQQNIDTGMGLERLAMVLQGKDSVFDTDLFRPIIDKFAMLVGTEYGRNHDHDRSLRVIADHGRALVFLAGDGVLPSNEGRGYIFRRVLRRAVRHGKLLGLDRPFLAEAADTVIELLGGHYHELVVRRDQIVEILSIEERKFSQTLSAGMRLLTERLGDLERRGERQVPGGEAFKLYDTHGFPLELTQEVAAERGMTVDVAGYQSAMFQQQEQSKHPDVFTRKGEEETWTGLTKTLPASEFTGYSGIAGSSPIVAIVADGQPADDVSAPQRAAIVLATTPFYAEAGGQVGDRGVIGGPTGAFQVEDTQRPVPGLIVHYGRMLEGHLRVGSEVRAEVDAARRRHTMRNHSATHLLHRALKDVLGDQVHQQGSLVAPDRLRFDFNHPRPLSEEETRAVESAVNDWVLDDLLVRTEIMPYRDALATGAMALFSEKYGDTVRVVTMGPSKELCGGTHCSATGQVGVYVVSQETSIAAGVRRIEALTGTGAMHHLRRRSDLVAMLADRLQTAPDPDSIAARVGQLQNELDEMKRRLAQLQRGQVREQAVQLAASPARVGDVAIVAAAVTVPDERALRDLADAIRGRLGSGVILLAAELDGQARFMVTVDEALTGRGVHGGKIAQAVGERLGGRGGGRPESAQGGGREVGRLGEAVASVREVVARQLG
jgi:alanyl-tRNA synthetase